MTKWTESRVETLKNLWAQGHSGSYIANFFGDVSRCAVIGKINRLGAARKEPSGPRKSKPPRMREPTHPLKMRAKRPRETTQNPSLAALEPVEADPVTVPASAPNQRCGVLGLSNKTCRWPIGDPRRDQGFHFCGALPAAESPYCEQHTALAYLPRTSKPSPAKGASKKPFYPQRRRPF